MKKNWKSLCWHTALVFAVVVLVVGISYHYIYPTLVCEGQRSVTKTWKGGGPNTPVAKVLENGKTQISASFLVRRGAVFFNEDRFPLYKELNRNNRFAEKTAVGYKGSESSEDFILKVERKFEFNKFTSQFSMETFAEGPHILDGDVGVDYVKLTFSGVCHQIWSISN